jgi:hypothetical protein
VWLSDEGEALAETLNPAGQASVEHHVDRMSASLRGTGVICPVASCHRKRSCIAMQASRLPKVDVAVKDKDAESPSNKLRRRTF